jgi:type II restriction enzyme
MIEAPDYEPAFAQAVRDFWGVRTSQTAKQVQSGKLDAGTRNAVTGGKHLDAIAQLIGRVMVDAGLEAPRPLVLPGYYRRSKNWDIVARYKGTVGAVVELKSQVGSIGNNANNRIEEMIGQSVDLWKAAREDLLGATPPWFGYVMLVEDSDVSTRKAPIPKTAPHFPPDRIFAQTSYLERYVIALDRLRIERDMDQVCLVASKPDGTLSYPNPTMTFQTFAATIHARGLQLRTQLSGT